MAGNAVPGSDAERAPARLFAALLLSMTLLLGFGVGDTSAARPAPPPVVGSLELTQGWALQSAGNVADSGGTISQVGYLTTGWHPIALPSTVLAGLVANNVYANIYFGTNLQSVPDLTTQNWWYRGEFTAPALSAGQQYWLRFKGISYRSQIWLNGTEIDPNAVGTMVVHEYNVTNLINPGAANALAILVTPPAHDCQDLSFCTVDWNPEAPDMNAGLWGKTFLDTTGPVALRDPYVKTVLPLPSTDSADLTVYVDAANPTNAPVTATIGGTITKAGYPSISFSQTVTLNANERREIAFDPGSFSQLHVTGPALWWPYQFGSPELYHLALSATTGGATSDTKAIDFGIRQFTDYRTTVNGTSFVGYKVNGRPIFLRGGGYVWDLLQRFDPKSAAATIQYVKGMGLNTIRFEGTVGYEDLYDLADKAGVMLMAGFVCCSAWENDKWTAEQEQVAHASLESQMSNLRAHPSTLVWAFGSDCPVSAAHLQQYKDIASSLHWQDPTLDSVATWCNSNAGMKMDGPYSWEPPTLWWDTSQAGSAFGTTAEEGTESPPPLESLQKFIGPADLWPIGSVWNYHAGKPKSVFDNISRFTDGVDNRYGKTTGAADYAKKSEAMNYENTRSFFEAWNAGENKTTFGTIFWMLNGVWPSVHWNLYDWYYAPGGGFFGAKKANEPVHIAYDYFSGRVVAYNSTLTERTGMTATATLYNIPDLTQKDTEEVTNLTVPADAATNVLTIPPVTGLSRTYFIRLQLKDATGAVVSNNLYWYSTSPDRLGNSHTWWKTAIHRYADLTGLNTLDANPNVTAAVARTVVAGEETATITLTNTDANNIAFFLRPEIAAGNGGTEVLPIDYSDNYVSLFPGESTTITARYASADLGGEAPYLRLRGYNVPPTSRAVP
jgi:exo-1,4-beta-D-glucosaminidase